MQIIDPVQNPDRVLLDTLNVGDVFTVPLSNHHYVVTTDNFAGSGNKAVLRLEDCNAMAMSGATEVVPRSQPTIHFG